MSSLPVSHAAATSRDPEFRTFRLAALRGGIDVIDQISEPWRALCHQSADDEPFYTPEWIAAHVRAFSPEAKLVIVTAHLDGELCFLLPLVKQRQFFDGVPVMTLRAPVSSHSCRFDGVRLWGHKGDAAVTAAWEFLENMPGWDVIDLRETPEGGTASALLEAAEAAGFRTSRIRMRSNPYIPVPHTQDGLNRLPVNSRLRGKLRHVRRELAGRGELRLRRVAKPSRVDLEKFYELEASGWKGQQQSAIAVDRRARQFYDHISTSARDFHYLCMYFLELDDQLIAAHLGLSYGQTYYSPKLAYNEAFKDLAPGHLIISEILQDCSSRGIRTYDITGPDDEWKMRWTSSLRQRFRQLIFNNRPLARAAHMVHFRVRPWARRTLLRRVPRS
jgi:CelD/BcsL family acetyltransferase involved in cellulose biosynthesis